MIKGDDIFCSSINGNTVKLKLRTTWSFSFTITFNTCPDDDKDITGRYISPKNVDWMLCGLLYFGYLRSSFDSSSLAKHACTYPTRCITRYKACILSFVAGYPSLNNLYMVDATNNKISSCLVLLAPDYAPPFPKKLTERR